MANTRKWLIILMKRISCLIMAHCWHFVDLHADGSCTAVCKRCGKREQARLLAHHSPRLPIH